MSTIATRLVGFAVALVVVFGGAYAAGSAIGPFDDGTTSEPTTSDSGASDHDDGHGR
jgi:hypothetical protein